MARLRDMLARAERPLVLAGRQWLDRTGPVTICGLSRRPTTSRSPSGFAARICSTTAIRAMSGWSGLGANPAPRRGGTGLRSLAGGRRPARRDHHPRGYSLLALPKTAAKAGASHIPGSTRSARSISPISGSMPACRHSPQRLPRWSRSGTRPGPRTVPKFAPPTRRSRKPTEMPGTLNLAHAVRHLESVLPEKRHRLQRRGKLFPVAAPVPPLSRVPHPAVAAKRLDGLRRPGGRRRRDPASRTRGRVMVRGTATS